MSISTQYVGFMSKLLTREYSFVVREELDETIEITFAIPNRVFTSRRLSFQNAPDLCSLKLHREMASSVDNVLKAHYRISEIELDDYNNSHLPKSAKGFTHLSGHKSSKRTGGSFPKAPDKRICPVV
jgi:hypothetical protein